MSAGSDATNILDRIAAIFGTVNNTALCTYLAYQYYQAYFGETITKKQKSLQKKLRASRKYQTLHTLSIISILFSSFFCLVRTIIAFDLWNNNCTVSTGTISIFIFTVMYISIPSDHQHFPPKHMVKIYEKQTAHKQNYINLHHPPSIT